MTCGSASSSSDLPVDSCCAPGVPEALLPQQQAWLATLLNSSPTNARCQEISLACDVKNSRYPRTHSALCSAEHCTDTTIERASAVAHPAAATCLLIAAAAAPQACLKHCLSKFLLRFCSSSASQCSATYTRSTQHSKAALFWITTCFKLQSLKYLAA